MSTKKGARKPTPSPEAHLSKDPVMRRLIKTHGTTHGPMVLQKHKDPFFLLCKAIIAQQISNAAAASITKKFEALFAGTPDKKPTPEAVRRKRPSSLRAAGVPPQKQGYLKSLAEKFLDKTITPRKFGRMDDEAIIEELIQVKGIGRWTAEMFLIFSLGRPDVFAYDDLGLRNTIKRLYPAAFKKIKGAKEKGTEQGVIKKKAEHRVMEKKAERQVMERIVEPWRPYRSYASLYLWAAIDNSDPETKNKSPW